MLGFVHSLESFGAVDGPGIRFLVFLKGCLMRCKYCHNPDTWNMDNSGAMTADDILNRAERFRPYWRNNGGITVSGGEPLLQMDFVTELFSKAHSRNIHTVLDTAAQPFKRAQPFISQFNKLMHVTDLVLLDIKHIDNHKHIALTGHENTNILEAALYLARIHMPVWIRHVLVPGLTDDHNDLLRLRDFIASLGNVQKVDVLPYHTLGRDKWLNLGMTYPLEHVDTPSDIAVSEATYILSGGLSYGK